MPRTAGLIVATLVILSACATQTPYQPAEKRGAEGYTETRLTDNRYRVTFTGNPVTPSETVKDYALLRAAEVTLQNGYDWFRLVNSDTDKKQRTTISGGSDFDIPGQTTVYQRCGLLSCSTAVSSTPGFSSGFDVATTSTSTAYSSSLEIVMGKKPMPASVESYDARNLASTLRRLMNKPQ
jgi:hypothetical protein